MLDTSHFVLGTLAILALVFANGFFVAAAVWMGLYFLWAWRAAAADRARRGDDR